MRESSVVAVYPGIVVVVVRMMKSIEHLVLVRFIVVSSRDAQTPGLQMHRLDRSHQGARR